MTPLGCCVPLTVTPTPFLTSLHLPPLNEVDELVNTGRPLTPKPMFGQSPDTPDTDPLRLTGPGDGAGAGDGVGDGEGDGDGPGGGAGALSCVTA